MGELIIIRVIVLIIFGVGKLPEIGAGLGKGIKSFRKSVQEPDEIDVTPEQPKIEQKEETQQTVAQPQETVPVAKAASSESPQSSS